MSDSLRHDPAPGKDPTQSALIVDQKLEAILLRAINDPAETQDTIANKYAVLMGFRQRTRNTDFGVVNRAILGRYKASGLNYIKEQAWKYAGKPIPEWAQPHFSEAFA